MKEFLFANWKKILIAIGALIIAVFIFKGANYIYKNTFTEEKYSYPNKSVQNQTFDQNVGIEKKAKRNGTQGEIKLKFDKKDLSEEYEIKLDKNINPTTAEVSVIGKLGSGSVNVKLKDDTDFTYFERNVSGGNIKQVSTSDAYAKNYRLVITPNAAQTGELTISYKLYY